MIIINTFLKKEKTIKNNILAAEIIQAKNEKDANMRIVRMGIKKMQVSDNSSNEKWDNDFKIYLNPDRAKAGITIARVESAKKKDFKILLSSAIRMIKKKMEFKKEMAAPKTSRFNKYI
jgi:hypothetical protein